MIKYSKFTDNTGSRNFTDTFCQNTDKFKKIGGGGGVTLLNIALARNDLEYGL